ncbi:Ctl protein, partial [Globisporangium splendens]
MRPIRSQSVFTTTPASYHMPTIPVMSGKSFVAIEVPEADVPAMSPASPLSAQVLRVHTEEKESTSLKKVRFVYEIETCHQQTGEVFRAERRFREFKQLREALLHECRDCATCRPFYEKLKEAKLPARKLVVLDAHKYGAQRVLELSHFLRDLVAIVSTHARDCAKHGDDIDKSVGLFLGVSSLKDAEDMATRTSQELIPPLKTRQERMEFRAASMPDFRLSSSSIQVPEELLLQRRRGLSEC